MACGKERGEEEGGEQAEAGSRRDIQEVGLCFESLGATHGF